MLERWMDNWLVWLDFWFGHLAAPGVDREGACPGHVAAVYNRKICGICGAHIDSLRENEHE